VPSLPIVPFPEGLQSAIESAPVQPFEGTLLGLDTQQSLKRKIKQILSNRNMYSTEYKSSWKTLFLRLPCENDTDRPGEHVNALAALIREYGRDVHGHPDFKPVPADLNDYGTIDSVQFTGGPIEHGQFMTFRRTIADGEKGCVRKRRQKSSEFSESSSDDNRNEKTHDKKENISKQSKKLSITKVSLVDAQPSLEDRVVKVVDAPAIKNDKRLKRPKKISRTEGPPVDSREDDVQAMVIDLLESSKELE
jgi:hypothetical protein